MPFKDVLWIEMNKVTKNFGDMSAELSLHTI